MTNPIRIALMTAASVALAAVLTSTAWSRSSGHGGSHVSEAATSACMQAVNANYGGKVDDLKVVHSEFSQANSEVVIEAIGVRGGSGSERWKCLVSNDGTVQDLSVLE